MKAFVLSLLVVALAALSASAQLAPEWYFTKLDDQQYALWRDGVQLGSYRLSDESYYPLRGGRWGEACECPCYLPPAIEAALAQYRKAHWQTRGVLMGPLRTGKKSSGLHYHNLPGDSPPQGELPDKPRKKTRCDCPDCPPDCNCGCTASPLSDDAEKIPDYSAMSSLTLVAKNEADASAALEMFEHAPELAHWRDKYGPRTKAYGAAEFQHTGRAFKLDQDKRFQEAGFVALIQPQAPGADGRALVRSYYTWATPEQALRALRDADPTYDPNPAAQPAVPSVDAAGGAGVWGKLLCGLGLGGGSVVMALGTLAALVKSVLS